MNKLIDDIKKFRNFIIVFYSTALVIFLIKVLINPKNTVINIAALIFLAMLGSSIIIFQSIDYMIRNYQKKILGKNNDSDD